MKALSLIVLATTLAAAEQPLTFEVASLKRGDGQTGILGGCHGIDSKYGTTGVPPELPTGRCVISNGRLSHLIYIAYDLPSVSSIKGAPDWVMSGTDRYTVEAKAEDPSKVTDAQLQQMLQNLIVERFKLKFHWETTERPGFRLVVGKNGPKLQPSTSDESVAMFGAKRRCCAQGVPIDMTVRGYSMRVLANVLSNIGPGPVVNQTGLKGEFDFNLSWDETNGPELTTALQEQLGLKLEPQKVPVPQFVIESAEKPETD